MCEKRYNYIINDLSIDLYAHRPYTSVFQFQLLKLLFLVMKGISQYEAEQYSYLGNNGNANVHIYSKVMQI